MPGEVLTAQHDDQNTTFTRHTASVSTPELDLRSKLAEQIKVEANKLLKNGNSAHLVLQLRCCDTLLVTDTAIRFLKIFFVYQCICLQASLLQQ